MNETVKEVKQNLKDLSNNDVFSTVIKKNLLESKHLISDLYNKNLVLYDTCNKLDNILFSILKSCIGCSIYKLSTNKTTYTMHTLTNVITSLITSEIYDTDDVKFKNTTQIFIELDNSAQYIIYDIENTIFFSEEDILNKINNIV